MNDAAKVLACGHRKVCGICGQKLERDVWLIGGPGAAFHEHGAFLDPPMHRGCAIYALMVCPYLGARYTGRVDAMLVKQGRWDPRQRAIEEGWHMIPEQPPFFVLARTKAHGRHGHGGSGPCPALSTRCGRGWPTSFGCGAGQVDEAEGLARPPGGVGPRWTTIGPRADLIHWQAPAAS